MSYDVFVSYSRRDAEIANRILSALEAAGFCCFIDRVGISGGVDFPAVLAHAILDSKLVLMLASEHSYQSEYTRKELVFTVNNRGSGAIFPLIIDGKPLPKDLEFMLSNINWRELSDQYRIEKELIDDIRKRLDHPDIQEVPAASEATAKRKGGKAFKMIAAIALFSVLIVGTVLAWQKREDQGLRRVAGQATAAFSSRLDSAERMLSEADSIRDLHKPELLFRAELAAITGASQWLSRADSIRSGMTDNPYATFENDRFTLLKNRQTFKTDSLYGVWKSYTVKYWNNWLQTGSSIYQDIARESIPNALALQPEDPELIEIAQKLGI